MWELSLSTDNRVFQGLSIPDITTTVLKQHNIDMRQCANGFAEAVI
jgi:uncharacterized protein involved in type VI secretion and phage assembly